MGWKREREGEGWEEETKEDLFRFVGWNRYHHYHHHHHRYSVMMYHGRLRSERESLFFSSFLLPAVMERGLNFFFVEGCFLGFLCALLFVQTDTTYMHKIVTRLNPVMLILYVQLSNSYRYVAAAAPLPLFAFPFPFRPSNPAAKRDNLPT